MEYKRFKKFFFHCYKGAVRKVDNSVFQKPTPSYGKLFYVNPLSIKKRIIKNSLINLSDYVKIITGLWPADIEMKVIGAVIGDVHI